MSDLRRIWGFLTEQQQQHYFRQLSHRAVDWDEKKTTFARDLVINGKSFNAPRLFLTQPGDSKTAEVCYSPTQLFSYRNRTFPRGKPLEIMQGCRTGNVWFTEDVVIPVLLTGPADTCPGRVWMSYTPMEILSQRKGLQLAAGTVVIGGFGMGWFTEAVMAKHSVKKVVVVEISQELIDWYGQETVNRLQKQYGKPIELICGDAKEHLGKHGKDARHLYDVWCSYPAYVTPEWRQLAQTVKFFWGWGWVKG